MLSEWIGFEGQIEDTVQPMKNAAAGEETGDDPDQDLEDGAEGIDQGL